MINAIGLPEEFAKQVLGMSGEGTQLPDQLTQSISDHPLQLILDRLVELVPTSKVRLYGALNQWHD